MPFGETADTYGKLLRNKSTSTGVTGQSTGLNRAGAPSGRAARGSVPASPYDYSGASSGRWGNTPVAAPPTAAPPAAPAAGGGFGAIKPGRSGLDANGNPPIGTPSPGTESGNTYLEDRYLQRLYGNDPAFNYAAKRGMQSLGNRSAAAGNFNSGAARQQEGDFMANLIASDQSQLDALAAGATGARQAKINGIYGTGLGLAGGQSATNSAYDLASARSMTDALQALLGYTTNKAGVDSQSNQQGINNLISGYSAIYGGGGK